MIDLSKNLLLEETKSNLDTFLIKDILLDADALVALAKKDDSNHSKAVKINNLLQNKGASYFLSPFTLAEAVTVLSYRVSHEAGKKLLKELRKIDLPILELPENYQDLADKWFLKQKKKGISYFDCYNMALLERYNNQLVAIFSFDEVYRKNGFKMVNTFLGEVYPP